MFTKENASEMGKRGGRPKGARTKLAEDFFRDLQADWKDHGPEVIKAVRTDKPDAYLTAVSRLMPREMTVEVIDHEAALRELDTFDEPQQDEGNA